MSADPPDVAAMDGVREVLAAAGFAATELRAAGEGECCRAWWVDDAHIVRVALSEVVDAELEREMAVLPTLAKAVDAAIPVPVHLGREPSTGRRLLVHRAVHGEPLEEMWSELSGAERRGIARELGRFLAELQGVALSSLPVAPPEARFHHSYARADVIEALVFPRMSAADVAACRDMVGGFEPCPREAWTLVHADLYNHHVLVRGQKLAGVIDFGDLSQGDPACDLGTLMDDFGVEFVADVLSDQPVDDARLQVERARFHCVWEALNWAAAELQQGRTAEVPENLRRVGRLALDHA